MIDISKFIAQNIIFREKSLFIEDIEANKNRLSKEIEGKSLLVIGGAGSIGSSFIKAVLPFKPASLFVVDISENGLTELTRDLRSTEGMFVPENYKTYPINYADAVFEKMFRAEGGFDIVANFSAHKHVRSEKDVYSVQALIENNVIRARKLLELLNEYKPQHFFCVSTDKAANPVNIMGGSKKMMEDMIMAYSNNFLITTARFANVAFSNGSLLAGFIDRMMKRQPFSAPADVRRYFVSPEESGQICMLACMLGQSGEIYFPKLHQDQMLTFAQIATRFLEDHGYKAMECSSEQEAKLKASLLFQDTTTTDYPVYYFNSDTTGEKPYEEFFTENEQVNMTQFSSLGVITNAPRRPVSEIDAVFSSLEQAFKRNCSKEDIVHIMKDFLKNFEHLETGKYLDSKM